MLGIYKLVLVTIFLGGAVLYCKWIANKKNAFFSCLFLCVFLLFLFPAKAQALEVNAKGAILIEATTGRVLWQQNAHERLPMASTTKVMTALLLMEKGNLHDKVTLPDDFVNVGESSIWLEPGETQELEDLFYAMMLKSANDAAQAIAIGVGGTEEKFIEMMNEKAKELGLEDTHFMNPHGLHNAEHYTTAYDLAMIAREDIKYEQFRKVVITKKHTLPWADNDYDRVVYNANNFLNTYEYATGIKTGYTRQAGSCLVGSAEKDGMQLIAVVLGCPQMYVDTKTIMEYGFENYKMADLCEANEEMGIVPVIEGRQDTVAAITQNAMQYPVKKAGENLPTAKVELLDSVSAMVTKGDILGQVIYTDTDGNSFQVPLVAANHVYPYSFRLLVKAIWQKVIAYWFV